MMTQGQLGESGQAPFFGNGLEYDVRANSGLLGNKAIQIPTTAGFVGTFWTAFSDVLIATQPTSKLAFLKRRTFTSQGRQLRIAASLEAIHAPQPTNLSLAAWKEIVEEVEDED